MKLQIKKKKLHVKTLNEKNPSERKEKKRNLHIATIQITAHKKRKKNIPRRKKMREQKIKICEKDESTRAKYQ